MSQLLTFLKGSTVHTIVVNSQKGGSGKTMLVKHLAIAADRAGASAMMIDTDPQGSLAAWHSARKSERPQLADVPFDQLPKVIAALRKRHATDVVLIDTASGRLDIAEALYRLADLVLIPIQPSIEDLRSLARTMQLLRKRKGVAYSFVLTRVRANTLITAQTIAALSPNGTIVSTPVIDRIAYRMQYQDEQTIIEAKPASPAAVEIAQLWTDICALLPAAPPQKRP
jgi:chromosome partitioning protein